MNTKHLIKMLAVLWMVGITAMLASCGDDDNDENRPTDTGEQQGGQGSTANVRIPVGYYVHSGNDWNTMETLLDSEMQSVVAMGDENSITSTDWGSKIYNPVVGFHVIDNSHLEVLNGYPTLKKPEHYYNTKTYYCNGHAYTFYFSLYTIKEYTYSMKGNEIILSDGRTFGEYDSNYIISSIYPYGYFRKTNY